MPAMATRPATRTRLARLPEEQALAAAARIVAACRPERVWLYGSRGRGDHEPHSDIDLMVVLPPGADIDRARAAARAAVYGAGEGERALDVQVMEHARFHERLHLKASFPAAIVRNGRILYEEVSMGAREARALLGKAQSDLIDAQALLAPDPPRTAGALFALEQAVEKAAKALMTLHDLPFHRNHDLADVAQRLRGREPDLAERVGALGAFARRAVGLRYPGDDPEPSADEARGADATVRALVADLAERIARREAEADASRRRMERGEP